LAGRKEGGREEREGDKKKGEAYQRIKILNHRSTIKFAENGRLDIFEISAIGLCTLPLAAQDPS
jgi:hypothetical protein